METGSIPISHVISSRRMMYLRTILRRDEEELTKRVLREQENNACPGDFIELVKDDFNKCKLDYNEDMIIAAKEEEYKTLVRKHIKDVAFKELMERQASHSKVSSIVYPSLAKQAYLESPMFSNTDVGVLSNLRSHTTRGIRTNFKQLYRDDLSCPLKCWLPGNAPIKDTQEHLLTCSKLELKNSTVAASDILINNIYGSVSEQKAVVTVIQELLSDRNNKLERKSTSGCIHWTQAPPGAVQAQPGTCQYTCSVCIGN